MASVCDLEVVYRKTPERVVVASGSQYGTQPELLWQAHWLTSIKEVMQRGTRLTKWLKQTRNLESPALEMRLGYGSQAQDQL